MNQEKEVWLPIKGYEDYIVSNKGRVKSMKFNKGRVLKSHKTGGYLSVKLSKNRKEESIRIHQLVAMAFLNHNRCGHKLVVDHIDNNPLNNVLNNLQIITHRENVSKDKKKKTSNYTGVCWDKTTENWKASITINKKHIHLGRFKDEIDGHNAYQKALKRLSKPTN